MNSSKVDTVTPIAINAIEMMQDLLKHKGFTPVIHFELEGCFSVKPSDANLTDFKLNYELINSQLDALGVEGKLIPEYWKNQWEYVSSFNGQLPLSEARFLETVIKKLPYLFAQQGVSNTYIKPVVWNGDKRKMPLESGLILSDDNRYVHIPNAIQINVSVNDSLGENIIVKQGFGEYLQQCLLASSFDCALLYLPEEEAFERLTLKQRYGLTKELSSPSDISGGHQGSIALYKQWGKHNQQMGEEVIVYDEHNNPSITFKNWEKTARIEHRLGASSVDYNPYVNIVYILMNVITALECYEKGECEMHLCEFKASALPESLYCKISSEVDNPQTYENSNSENKLGAIQLFVNSSWFNSTLNRIEKLAKPQPLQEEYKLGDELKDAISSNYLLRVAQ